MSKFNRIYKLAEELQEKYYKKEYEKMLEENIDVGTLEEYINNEISKLNSDTEKNNLSEDLFLCRDTIKKSSIKFDLYIIKYLHTMPVELDENYKVLPLEQKNIYEYGLVATLYDVDGSFSISDICNGVEDDENTAKEKYEQLKNKFEKMSEEELLVELENLLLSKLND